jgi:hypothetical protein
VHIVGVIDSRNVYIYRDGAFKHCSQYTAAPEGTHVTVLRPHGLYTMAAVQLLYKNLPAHLVPPYCRISV